MSIKVLKYAPKVLHMGIQKWASLRVIMPSQELVYNLTCNLIEQCMIKYYLHGGNSSADYPNNNDFRASVVADIQANPRILLCYFGNDTSEYEAKFAKDKEVWSSTEVNLDFTIAKPEIFAEQCAKSGMLLLSGGDAFKLISVLRELKFTEELVKDKVVVGSSAGACAIAKYFYSNDENRVGKGLGLLNIKLHCHFDPGKIANIEKLQQYGEELATIALPERNYVSFYK